MNGLRRVPMAGGTKTLPASLTRKLTQRGEYNAEAALIKADRDVTQAANALRNLVRIVYADDADLVLNNLRQAVDASGALGGDVLAGLTAEATFYNKATAEILAAVDARDKAQSELDTLQTSRGRGAAGWSVLMGWVTDDFDNAQRVLDKFKEKVQ